MKSYEYLYLWLLIMFQSIIEIASIYAVLTEFSNFYDVAM